VKTITHSEEVKVGPRGVLILQNNIFYLYNFLFSKTKKQVRKTKSFLFFWCFTFPLFNALTTISRKTSSTARHVSNDVGRFTGEEAILS